MQSVHALIDTLRSTSIVINDVEFQAKTMYQLAHTISDKLLYSKGTLQSKVKVIHGGMNVEAIKIKGENLTIEAKLLDGVLNILQVWPLVMAKTKNLVDSSESCKAQAVQASELAGPLTEQMQKSESSQDFTTVSRVQLSAFNSDMAQLVERTAVLEFLATSLRQDMMDVMELFRYLRGSVEVAKSGGHDIDKHLLKTMGELLKIMWTFSEATIKVYNSVKNMPTSQLVHPIALEVPAPSASTISAEERLKNAALALSYK
jgi:hypothetical protein